MSDIKVVSVNTSPEKGTSKHPVPEITLDDQGVVDDSHRGSVIRQISFLDTTSIDAFAKKAGRAFDPGEFAENITTEGLDFRKVSVLDALHIGPVDLQVVQLGKKCHGDTCAIFREVGACVMPKEGFFCRAITGGTVKANDSIIHTPRSLSFRVITVSDRVSTGESEDRSGPSIVTALEEFFRDTSWRITIDSSLVPDEKDRIRANIQAARHAGADVIITTGGTGVGPRDVTPDVVTAMADKLIPGIMEHIRLTYGKEKPNALLSRSVAAVCGTALVYTLPGSVRASAEYISEILKTLEHTILMLHRIDAH